VDAHFAEKKRNQVLLEARKLMLNKEFQTVETSKEVQIDSLMSLYVEIEGSSYGLFQFPANCKITATTKQLVDLAYATLDDATNSSYRWYVSLTLRLSWIL
jgi:hypothetical protein